MNRDPETIRRWIRSGRLRTQKVGTQHVIAEEDLEALGGPEYTALPPEWRVTVTGEPMPDWLAILRRSRASH